MSESEAPEWKAGAAVAVLSEYRKLPTKDTVTRVRRNVEGSAVSVDLAGGGHYYANGDQKSASFRKSRIEPWTSAHDALLGHGKPEPHARPVFPPACCAASACAKHYALGYKDASPCGEVDLAALQDLANAVLWRPGLGWNSSEALLARGVFAALAKVPQ